MPRAEIYIEDSEPGPGVDVCFAFLGGDFNPASGAHQVANRIRSVLDSMAASGHLTALPADGDQPAEDSKLQAPAGS